MSGYYKLVAGIDSTTTLNVARRDAVGITYSHIKLMPGQKYPLDNDEVFLNSLKNARVQTQYSRELADNLNSLGIPYEEHECRACGGRIKKISYVVVEVSEE